MKTSSQPPTCALQSIIYTPERRVMIFTSKVTQPGAAHRTATRGQPTIHLKLLMAPEAQFNFELVVQVRSQEKP